MVNDTLTRAVRVNPSFTMTKPLPTPFRVWKRRRSIARPIFAKGAETMSAALDVAGQLARVNEFVSGADGGEAEAEAQRAPRLRAVNEAPCHLPDPATARVAVVGLGYVGLPLVCGFSKAAPAIGLDIDESKVASLRMGRDETGEVTARELSEADVDYCTDAAALAEADVIVVCVPTPVDARNLPDYRPLVSASRAIGRNMKRGAVVVFESTVDPGATEGRCLPVLEVESGLMEGHDFFLGYSPERINPADPSRRLQDIKKIVAGRTPEVTDFLATLYARVVHAGLFPAASIKVAEAAKILENTQRDVNIALMNQMMSLFDKMGLRASDVIAAASSKWNFHNYRPGLVGGHCIAVDPYWLVDAGRRHGLAMELVAASRAVNEATPAFLVEKLEELFGTHLRGRRVLVLGRSFKENCPDTRNSKAFPLMDLLWSRGADVFNHDPVAVDDHWEGGRGAVFVDDPFGEAPFDAVIVTLGHEQFRTRFHRAALEQITVAGAPLIDMRGQHDGPAVHEHFRYWRP